MIDTFKILEAKYSKSKRNWIGAFNAIGGLTLSVILLMNCVPLVFRITDSETVSFILILLLAFVFPVIMLRIEKKITNAYFVIGHLDFNDKSLSINSKDTINVDYRAIKIVYLSPTLVLPKANIISFTAQIVTVEKGVIEVHIHINSDSFKDKKSLFLFRTKKDIFDILKEKRIRYEWIRKKKTTHNTRS